ncbi:hypothetical protein JXB31_00150 [Candidatus Woesearchaeota archaeon]|nr:hypothetical protein [Candidatus Woesearchaeota archaeon]
MLKFLKRMLKKEQEAEVLRIEKSRLKPWLSDEKKKRSDELDKDVKIAYERIREAICQAKELVLELESAELHNKKITTREINMMEGNRKAYMRNTEDFLEKIKRSMGSVELDEFISCGKKHLEILGKSNIRPYSVMQHFFANESRKVAEKIKRISDELDELKARLGRAKLVEFEKAGSLIRLSEERSETRRQLKEDKDKKLVQKKETEDAIKKEESELARLNHSKGFLDYERLKAEKARIAELLKKHEDEFCHMFVAIDSALKKYSRIALDQRPVNMIIESPADAAATDAGSILTVIANITDAVSRNTLELKDKKREKTLSALKCINAESVESFNKRSAEIKQQKSGIEKKLQHNSIMRDYEDTEYRIENLRSRLDILEKEIKGIDKKIERIESEISEHDMAEKIKDMIGIEIELAED